VVGQEPPAGVSALVAVVGCFGDYGEGDGEEESGGEPVCVGAENAFELWEEEGGEEDGEDGDLGEDEAWGGGVWALMLGLECGGDESAPESDEVEEEEGGGECCEQGDGEAFDAGGWFGEDVGEGWGLGVGSDPGGGPDDGGGPDVDLSDEDEEGEGDACGEEGAG